MKIRNKQLYEEYKKFSTSAFNMLKEYSDKKPVFPFTVKEKVTFHRNGTSFSTYYKKKPDLKRFIRQHDKKILNLDEFNTFSDFINNDKRIKFLRKIDGILAQHAPSYVLIDFLPKLAEKTGSFKFSVQSFNKLYKEYEDYIYLDTINYKCFCFLINFQSDIEKIKLNSGLIIKKISNIERRKAWRMRAIKESDLLTIKWIAQLQVNVKRKERFAWEPSGKNFDDLITALRLFKVGVVGYKHIYSYPLSKWEETIRGNVREREFSGKKYTLSKPEVYEFKKWWKKYKSLKGIKWEKEIDTAIKRFNYAYERVNLEDKLIDYIVAFESLLLTGEPEKRFRFALNGAFLLGKEITELKERNLYMREVRGFLSEAYKLRNNVVHGSKSLENKIVINRKEIPMQKFIETIENYLRKSIKIYLRIRKRQGKKKILEELDNAIFDTN